LNYEDLVKGTESVYSYIFWHLVYLWIYDIMESL